MQLILKYHGELVEYFPENSEENMTRVDIDDEDSVFTIMEKFKIPRNKINLILVNGVKINHDDCESYRFSDGDTLAVWPVTD